MGSVSAPECPVAAASASTRLWTCRLSRMPVCSPSHKHRKPTHAVPLWGFMSCPVRGICAPLKQAALLLGCRCADPARPGWTPTCSVWHEAHLPHRHPCRVVSDAGIAPGGQPEAGKGEAYAMGCYILQPLTGDDPARRTRVGQQVVVVLLEMCPVRIRVCGMVQRSSRSKMRAGHLERSVWLRSPTAATGALAGRFVGCVMIHISPAAPNSPGIDPEEPHKPHCDRRGQG